MKKEKKKVFVFQNSVHFHFQICIPKYSSCVKQKVTEADVKDHVLFPDSLGDDEEENSLYRTMSRKVFSFFSSYMHVFVCVCGDKQLQANIISSTVCVCMCVCVCVCV